MEVGQPRFCPNCATPLDTKQLEQRARRFCPKCGYVHYQQLKVGVGAYIEKDGRLLLLQRTHNPFAGYWNLPAGYVEADESPERAIIREVAEETGLQVEVKKLLDVFFFSDDPRGNGILIVYECTQAGGDLSESSEAVLPTYFPSDAIPGELAGGGHGQAIEAWCRLVKESQ
jgi:8-oxo-dGTP diphosphatase